MGYFNIFASNDLLYKLESLVLLMPHLRVAANRYGQA